MDAQREAAATRIQACFRGHRVRAQLFAAVRREYEELFEEIEGGLGGYVKPRIVWREGSLLAPSFFYEAPPKATASQPSHVTTLAASNAGDLADGVPANRTLAAVLSGATPPEDSAEVFYYEHPHADARSESADEHSSAAGDEEDEDDASGDERESVEPSDAHEGSEQFESAREGLSTPPSPVDESGRSASDAEGVIGVGEPPRLSTHVPEAPASAATPRAQARSLAVTPSPAVTPLSLFDISQSVGPTPQGYLDSPLRTPVTPSGRGTRDVAVGSAPATPTHPRMLDVGVGTTPVADRTDRGQAPDMSTQQAEKHDDKGDDFVSEGKEGPHEPNADDEARSVAREYGMDLDALYALDLPSLERLRDAIAFEMQWTEEALRLRVAALQAARLR